MVRADQNAVPRPPPSLGRFDQDHHLATEQICCQPTEHSLGEEAGVVLEDLKDPLVVERFHPRISTSVMFALGHLADEVLSEHSLGEEAGVVLEDLKDPLVVERFHPRISTSVMFALGHLADEVLSIIRATAPPVDSHLRIRTKRSRPVDDAVSLP